MRHLRFAFLLLGLLFLSYCGSDDGVTEQIAIPDTFTVDIPSSLSSPTGTLSGRTSGDGDGVIEGDEIYESLRHFINIGEQSAEIVEYVLQVGAALEQANVTTFTFTGDEDGREKRIDIVRNSTRGGVTFDYEMTLVDTEEDDRALQMLWNTSPMTGIAILNPYQLERTTDTSPDVHVRVDYSTINDIYDEFMLVTISGIDPIDDGDIDNLALFAGRVGDEVDVIGNSNHPNLTIIDETFAGGRNYAFVGRANENSGIGVAKLALPPSTVNTSNVLDPYSVFSVLEDEIQSVGITDQALIDQILVNAQSPAYFNSSGFISAGPDNVPDGFSSSFIDLSSLTPFIPDDVRTLEVTFIP